MDTLNITEVIKTINPQILGYLNQRLQEWATWNLKRDYHGLNFHSHTMEYKILVYGNVPREEYRQRPLPINATAEEMENVIRIMASQTVLTKNYAAALKEFYIGKGRGKQRDAAKTMGVSVALYQKYFRGAYLWLAGWFTREFVINLSSQKVKF